MNLPDYQIPNAENLPADDRILVVTLNRPDVLNAINTQMGHDLPDIWSRLAVEAGDIRCVVLTGAGQ